MIKRIKVKKELLQNIEKHMENQCTLKDMQKELNLDDRLLKREDVKQAIERGRLKARDLSNERQRLKEGRVNYALSPSKVYINDFVKRKFIEETDFKEICKKVKEIKDTTKKGDYDFLIDTLLSNTILMQTRIENLNHNITREDVSAEFINKQTSLQIKMLEEIRRTTLTIQQLVEPKRTMFIKGDAIGQQNNQVNFQNNHESENEQSYKEVKNAKLLE